MDDNVCPYRSTRTPMLGRRNRCLLYQYYGLYKLCMLACLTRPDTHPRPAPGARPWAWHHYYCSSRQNGRAVLEYLGPNSRVRYRGRFCRGFALNKHDPSAFGRSGCMSPHQGQDVGSLTKLQREPLYR